jgi:phosphatidylglycerol:prolipoprotein diacylglycerol transferase
MSWFGGFAGGVAAGLWMMRRSNLAWVPVLAAAAPGLAVGHAIGRIGCLLVGDDYGRPSTLPWAIAFPRGLPPTDLPVHPTQIYEAIPLFALAAALIRLRRRGVPDARVLGIYLLSAGLLRFAIEFLRVNERVMLGLSVAHLASLLVAAAGAALLLWAPETGSTREAAVEAGARSGRAGRPTMKKGPGTAERRPPTG